MTVAHYTLTDGRFRKETKRTQIICKSDKSLSIYSLHFINPGKTVQPCRGLTPRVSLRMFGLWRHFPPRLPCLPILKGAEDTCTGRTWWRANTARAPIRNAPETKTTTRLCATSSTCPARAAARLMSCQKRLVVAQSSQSAGLTF